MLLQGPTGGRAPGSPSREAWRAVEDALLEAMGEKAEAEPAMRARTAANFIVTDCCLSCEIVSLRIVRGWKLLDERFFL